MTLVKVTVTYSNGQLICGLILTPPIIGSVAALGPGHHAHLLGWTPSPGPQEGPGPSGPASLLPSLWFILCWMVLASPVIFRYNGLADHLKFVSLDAAVL